VPRQLKHQGGSGDLQVQELKSSSGLTIEEIVNSPIVSASSRKESALSAPAMVIVLTGKDLMARGYTDLSQMLDDLPGMDVVRPYGDVYARSYWRGYRPGSGADPYLVMLDGIVFNSLFYGDTQIFATFPMSNIDHVEIVYGPASAVYGANAEMGVINVITKDKVALDDAPGLGASADVRTTYGGAQRNLVTYADSSKIVDATASYGAKDWRIRVSARFEDSVLDRSIGDDFEYTKSSYYSNTAIWGPAASVWPNLAGQFRSPDQKRAVDARLYLGQGLELGAQYFQMSTGLGVEYAADQIQTSTPWTTNEGSVFGRYTATLSSHVSSTTLLQYRISGVASPSSSLVTAPATASVNFLAVDAPNSAEVLQQDFDAIVSRNLFLEGDVLEVNFGVKGQHLDLSKYYRFLTNFTYPAGAPVPAAGMPIMGMMETTSPSAQVSDGRNQIDTVSAGAYALAKYAFPKANAVHLGVRGDYNGLTDDFNPTFRGGYVGTFGDLTGKLLYGQAVYAPGPFDLYRAPTALKEERSQTVEANVQYTLLRLAVLMADVYDVTFSNPIVSGGYMANSLNLGSREIAGADVGARLYVQPIEVWAYYSRFITANETSATDNTSQTIGDLAFDKVWAGATYDRSPITATVLGRYIGPREPVATNTLGRVSPYFTIDANLVVSHVGFDGLSLGLRIANLLDTQYQQPGIVTAGSGGAPGGSQDIYNSRLPQPRRSLFLTARLAL
jgi:iron complex outermembrane receptor protein